MKHYVVVFTNKLTGEIIEAWYQNSMCIDKEYYHRILNTLFQYAAEGIEYRLMQADVYIADSEWDRENPFNVTVEDIKPVISIEAMTVVYGATINVYMTCGKYVRVMNIAN